jgi:hypothetical protein
MKRPSAASTHQSSSKKQKTSPLALETEITHQEQQNDTVIDAQWQKVERRKAKKARKSDAKLDVCVCLLFLSTGNMNWNAYPGKPSTILVRKL